MLELFKQLLDQHTMGALVITGRPQTPLWTCRLEFASMPIGTSLSQKMDTTPEEQGMDAFGKSISQELFLLLQEEETVTAMEFRRLTPYFITLPRLQLMELAIFSLRTP